MTPEEKRLWYDFLKTLPFTVNRQKVIGNYIVDFYCAKANLVIELDGGQHYESLAKSKDQRRDVYLHKMGILVIRYTNIELNQNFQGVCADILKHLNIRTASKVHEKASP